ncbi:ABC transporter permease [Candidatus Harpocratesius sp.]
MSEDILSDTRSRLLRITNMVRKEIKTLISDKTAMFILFFIPFLLILILGTSQPRLEATKTTIWIIDYDHSEGSEQFIETMKSLNLSLAVGQKLSPKIYASGELAPIEPNLGDVESFGNVTEELAQRTIKTQYLDAYIILHQGFEDDIAINGTTTILVYYDAIDFTKMIISDMIVLVGSSEIQVKNMLFERDIIYFPETRPKNYDLNILDLGAPYFIPLMLFFTMQLISTQSIVGDIPLRRLLNTSLKRGEVITGKLIAYTIIGIFQVLLSISMLSIFKVTMHCLWLDLFLILLLNSIVGITMGIFISTITKSRLQASQLFLLLFFLMYINVYYVRNIFFLTFIPIEQTRIAYEFLAYRGKGMVSIWAPILYMCITGLFFYLASVIYIKFIKKEFI